MGIANGSWQTTLLLFALDRAGLGWADIEPVDTDIRDGNLLCTADLDAGEAAQRGRPFGVGPVTAEFLDEQQRGADLLAANGLLPARIDVRAAVLPWIAEAIAATTAAVAR